MFEFYDDMTIEDAVKFQGENYYVVDEKEEKQLNITRMEECRKEMLDALTGGSQEAFNNILLLGEPKPLYGPDGFIYTSDGENLICVGAIADAENLFKANHLYGLVCIADKIAAGAFAKDAYDKPITLFCSIAFPFLKPHSLPAHSMRNQEEAEIYAYNLTEEERLDALSFVTTAEKLLLNVKEAHELFNLSERSLYDFARKNPNSHTILHHGNRVYFKRELFEKYIKEQAEWNYGL